MRKTISEDHDDELRKLRDAAEQLRDEVAKTTDVNQSVVLLLNGIKERLQKAVNAALVNGATAAQLESLTTEIVSLGEIVEKYSKPSGSG